MTNEEIQSFKNKCINEYPAIVRFVAIHYTSDQQISSKFKKQRQKLHLKLENNLKQYQLEEDSSRRNLQYVYIRRWYKDFRYQELLSKCFLYVI